MPSLTTTPIRLMAWVCSTTIALVVALLTVSTPAASARPQLTPLTPKTYDVLQDIAVSSDRRWAAYIRHDVLFVTKVGSHRARRIGRVAGSLERIAVSAGGRTVTAELSTATTNHLVIWNRATGKKRRLSSGFDLSFAQTADGSRTAYLDRRGALRLYSARTGASVLIDPAPDEDECDHAFYYDTQRAVAISNDGSTIVFGTCDPGTDRVRLAVWRQSTKTSAVIPGTISDGETPLSLTSDGSTLFYNRPSNGERHHWFRVDPSTGRATEIRFPVGRAKRNQIQFATFSADGRWVAFSPEVWQKEMNDRRIAKFNSYVWRLGTTRKTVLFKARRVRGHLVTGYPMSITPDGSAVGVVAAGWDSTPGSTKSIVAVWRRR